MNDSIIDSIIDLMTVNHDERSLAKGAQFLTKFLTEIHGGNMQASDIEWSQAERNIAQAAFETAYEREIKALIQEVCDRASAITKPDDMWQLHDFLSARRHAIDGKYDDRDSALIFVFAQLVKEGWLHLKELEGLKSDKLTKVAALTRM